MSNSSWKKWSALTDLLVLTIPPFILWYVLRNHLLNRDTFRPNKEVSDRLENILDRHEEDDDAYEDDEFDDPTQPKSSDHRSPRRSRRAKDLVLNSYEQSIASEVVHPDDIAVSFSDIGGLDPIISDLQESVIYPLTMPSLYQHNSPLLSAPSGVLLFGPPGCGKTMLAKALAHESGAVFINVHISTLTEKWYGDSNKLVAAVFSLARKLAPAIVFIDELDTLLGSRRSGEHEASGMVKAEMMTHMDGLTSTEKGTGLPQRVLMLGATNRPQDIDEAILRRMPKRFAIGLPDATQRRRILELLLKGMKLDGPELDLEELVGRTSGMSGSDLKEMCREAAMVPVREAIRSRRAAGQSMKGMRPDAMRSLRTDDFEAHMSPLNSGSRAHRSSRRKYHVNHEQAQHQVEEDTDDYTTTDEEDISVGQATSSSISKSDKSRASDSRARRKQSREQNGVASV